MNAIIKIVEVLAIIAVYGAVFVGLSLLILGWRPWRRP